MYGNHTAPEKKGVAIIYIHNTVLFLTLSPVYYPCTYFKWLVDWGWCKNAVRFCVY